MPVEPPNIPLEEGTVRYYWKRDPSMSFLLACLLTTAPACSPDASLAVGTANYVAAVAVLVDSSTLSVGHTAQVSITAVNTAGLPIDASSVAWTSITPEIVSVSSTGAVTAISSGEAVIEGKVSQSTGRVKLVITDSSFRLATNNFNNGELAPYTNPWGIGLDFPEDPTASGRGTVARFRYTGGNGDQNRAMEFTYKRGWGEPMHFKGEFNLPVSDLAVGDMQRKLVYWQSHNDYAKYPKNGGLATGRTVVHLAGSDLVVDATFNPEPGTGRNADDVRTVATVASGIKGNKWYTLEVFQRMETAIGLADGVLQVWLDGVLIFDKSTMTWSDPAWVGNTSSGVPFAASDIYFEHFMVGEQVNWMDGSFDEYRYWDNVEFSTRRTGR